MGRPKQWDKDVLDRAAVLLADDLPDDLGDQAGVVHDLREALDRAMDIDGYAIARELENLGWTVDAALVEDLDGGRLDDALHEITAAWITTSGAKPRFSVGDKVCVALRDNAAMREHEGEVVGINFTQGTYLVCVAALGHIKEGAKATGTLGYHLPWEDVERLTALEQATSELSPAPKASE